MEGTARDISGIGCRDRKFQKMTSKEESDMSDELKDLLDYILNAEELDSAVYCDRMSFSELRAWQDELILKAKKVRGDNV